MSGQKGRSGRRINLEGITIAEIVAGAISLTYRFMNDETQPLDKRADVASRFVLKRIADKINLEVQYQLTPDQIELIQQRISATLANSNRNPQRLINS